MTDDDALIDACARESLALLRANVAPAGLMAASPTRRAQDRSYTAVFARDAAISTAALLASGEPALATAALAGLRTLAAHQAANGQIPKFVAADGRHADFWYVGCIDATLWWLIALELCARRLPESGIARELAAARRRALTWLACQEHPTLRLLTQNEASDWADIMPRSGFVLYSNALWYHVKRLYGLPGMEATHYHFNHLFYPFEDALPDYRRLRLLRHFVRRRAKNRALYLSFVNFGFWGEEGDVFGNLLAVLFGLAPETRAAGILRALGRAHADTPCPVRSVLSPIAQDDPLWRAYMGRHRQNLAGQYHNGGAWPMLGGFWALALARLKQPDQARAALAQLARANRVGDWGFYEWFHADTGQPHGMRGQTWNAAMFLTAAGVVRGEAGWGWEDAAGWSGGGPRSRLSNG